jgi:sulfide:quinone oxidoreductase
MTAGELAARPGGRRTEIVLVTHEDTPLHLFGAEASNAVALLLEREGISVHTRREVETYRSGRLKLLPHGELQADHVVAMPLLEGPALEGLPHDEDGFIPTDAFGRVSGVQDVYAAGDVTAFAIKQGGLASQQADVVAASLAAWAGAAVQPTPFRPVLRGQLLTSGAPRFLEVELGEPGQVSTVEFRPPSWPAGKISARYLTPFLAKRGVGDPIGWPQPGSDA